MLEPCTDSAPEAPLVSFSRLNTWLPTTIPTANSSTQASSTHRRFRTQKRATDAYMSPSQAEVFADVRVVPAEPRAGESQLASERAADRDRRPAGRIRLPDLDQRS